MQKLLTIGAAAVALLAPAATASANPGWHSCSAQTRSVSGWEYYGRFSGLQARSPMNCASARYAYNFAFGIARRSGLPRSFNDGYVRWYRQISNVRGPSGGGCGTWRSTVTYREYTSGTAFRFRLFETGC
jgi:opacity protein-like surface antigen